MKRGDISIPSLFYKLFRDINIEQLLLKITIILHHGHCERMTGIGLETQIRVNLEFSIGEYNRSHIGSGLVAGVFANNL